MSPMNSDPARQLLRHTVATLAYRGGKALRGAPAEFATFRAGESSRAPVEILAHVGDLFDWAVALCEGRHVWRDAAPGSWESETGRFFDGLRRFDDPRFRRAARLPGREAVPGAGRRRAHPHRPDR